MVKKNTKIYNVADNIIKIELDSNKIDELITKLNELKENKGHIHFSLNKNHELLVHHEEDEPK